jgi:hypothetical protein
MELEKSLGESFEYLRNMIKPVNDSKLFAGLVILTLNLSSKMTTLPMSRTVESIVKHSFSQYVLVFAISWMGTRDIFTAILVTLIFAVLMEFLFNERSSFCCFTESFVSEKLQVLEQFEGNPDELSKEELDAAMKTIGKAQRLLKESKEEIKNKRSTI